MIKLFLGVDLFFKIIYFLNKTYFNNQLILKKNLLNRLIGAKVLSREGNSPDFKLRYLITNKSKLNFLIFL